MSVSQWVSSCEVVQVTCGVKMRRNPSFPRGLLLLGFFLLAVIHKALTTCPPLSPRKGVVVACRQPNKGNAIDCGMELPAGSEAFYRCRKYYVNADGEELGGKMLCTDTGRWTKISDFEDFVCAMECGRAYNSTLQTVSSFFDNDGKYFFEGEIFPWHAAIFRRIGETNSFRYACGGSLINPFNRGFLVVTAAHCLTKGELSTEADAGSAIRVVLGAISTDLQSNFDAREAQLFSARKVVIDREYDPTNFQSDIGVIQLDKPVKLNDKVRPICFPNRAIANAQVRPGVEAYIPVLRNDDLHYQEITNLAVSETGECRRSCNRMPTITEFCGNYIQGSSKVTRQDSGSGLAFNYLTENPVRYYIQGIMTKVADRSENCAKYNAFTSINVFTDWINRVHEDLLGNSNAAAQSSIESTASILSKPIRTTTGAPFLIGSSTSATPVTTTTLPTTLPPITSTEAPEDYLTAALVQHNIYRRRHQSPSVQMSAKLTQEAQNWAEYLLNENKWEFSTNKDYSENIFQYFGTVTPGEAVKLAIKNWYDSSTKYNFNKPEASTFTQLIWKASTHIGIGVAGRGSKTVVVSNYYPKGNVYNLGLGDRAKYFRENVLPATTASNDDPPNNNREVNDNQQPEEEIL